MNFALTRSEKHDSVIAPSFSDSSLLTPSFALKLALLRPAFLLGACHAPVFSLAIVYYFPFAFQELALLFVFPFLSSKLTPSHAYLLLVVWLFIDFLLLLLLFKLLYAAQPFLYRGSSSSLSHSLYVFIRSTSSIASVRFRLSGGSHTQSAFSQVLLAFALSRALFRVFLSQLRSMLLLMICKWVILQRPESESKVSAWVRLGVTALEQLLPTLLLTLLFLLV